MTRYTRVCSLREFSRVPLRVLVSALFLAVFFPACTIFAPRPVQEMSFTSAAIRAAREVQADTLAPELFRQANEWHFKAKHEYKFKSFKLAKEYADKARYFAEQAEFEALRNGGSRNETPTDTNAPAPSNSNPTPPSPTTPYAYPTPQGTPVEVYAERKAAEDKAREEASKSNFAPLGGPPTSVPSYDPNTATPLVNQTPVPQPTRK